MATTATQVNIKVSSNYEGPFEDVAVNTEKPIVLETEDYTVHLVVRIKDYHHSSKLVPSEYFDHKERHSDRFSIQFVVKFKKDVSGKDLQFGNDFDRPIRDILPLGFSAALKTFKWAIDPSVDGDVYADKPYLYGPSLTSINFISKQESLDIVAPLEESLDAPSSYRRKKYLDQQLREKFVFEKDSIYAFDFVTPYLSMGDRLEVKIPGFTFDVGKYANTTTLRYVLKNADQLIFALVFSVDSIDEDDQESSEAKEAPADTDAKAGPDASVD